MINIQFSKSLEGTGEPEELHTFGASHRPLSFPFRAYGIAFAFSHVDESECTFIVQKFSGGEWSDLLWYTVPENDYRMVPLLIEIGDGEQLRITAQGPTDGEASAFIVAEM